MADGPWDDFAPTDTKEAAPAPGPWDEFATPKAPEGDSSWSHAITGVPEEAWRTTKEMAGSTWDSLKGAFTQRQPEPNEGFWEGYGRDIAAVPGKFGKAASGVMEAGMVPLAPAIGAAKSLIGRPMAHGIHALGEYINPAEAAKQTPEGVYQDIRGDVGTAVQTFAPWRGKKPGLPSQEGEIIPPPGGPAGGAGGPGRGGPTIEGEWYSPAESRPNLKVGDRETRLLPHDYQPEPDAMGRYGVGAAASPGGPLHGMLPETVAKLKEDLAEFTPHTLGQRIEDMSPHMPFAHISEQTRGAAGGLYSHPGQSKVEIHNVVSQLARERPERLDAIASRAFGPAENTLETQKVLQKEKAELADPFWQRFLNTPIPPTNRLMALEQRIRDTGAWQRAEKELGIEGTKTSHAFKVGDEEVAAPTPAFYEAVRQELERQIADLYTHAGDNSSAIRRRVGLFNAIKEAVNAHPDQEVAGRWGQSLEISGRYAKAQEAMKTGERLMTQNVHEFQVPEIVERFDDWQKGYLVKGIRKWVGDQLGRKGTGLATINNILTGPAMRKIASVIGDEKAAALFRDLQHEREMIDYEADLIGNKRTGASAQARKMQSDRFGAPEGGASDILGKAGNFIKHPIRTMGASALEAGQRALDTKAAKTYARMREELSRIHTLQGPERDAVARHLIGDEPTGDVPNSGPPMSPVPRPPEPSIPTHANAEEATATLREFGWPQEEINRTPAPMRLATADAIRKAYPNGPPPKPVASFPADREMSAILQPIAPAPDVGQGKVSKPLSLLEWIRKQGGISPDDPMIGDVRGMFGGKNPGAIVRKGGKTLDQLREGAVGEKYFLDQGDIEGREASTDINTLLDAMEREARGEKQYRVGEEVEQAARGEHELDQRHGFEAGPEAKRFDTELSRFDVTPDMVPTDIRHRALEIMMMEGERDPVIAYERALEEKYERGGETDETGGQSWEGLIFPQERERVAPASNGNAAERKAGDGEAVRSDGSDNREKKPPLKRASGGRVDPNNIHTSPSEAQKEAGNYAKDHVRIHGLDLTIENAKGSKRSGVDKGGKPWSVTLPHHYGYLKKTEGADGDHVDCYLGPHTKAPMVYIVDQQDANTKKFDEHKIMLAFASAQQARNCYLKAFSDGQGPDRLGAMHEMTIGDFKEWLAKGDTTKPMSRAA